MVEEDKKSNIGFDPVRQGTRTSQKVEQMDTLRYISEGGPYGTGRLVHAY